MEGHRAEVEGGGNRRSGGSCPPSRLLQVDGESPHLAPSCREPWPLPPKAPLLAIFCSENSQNSIREEAALEHSSSLSLSPSKSPTKTQLRIINNI